MLASGDVDSLSLRALARNVGVSATAVYRHFPDKEALLSALAREGGVQLAKEQRRAQAAAPSAKEGFGETGAAYVRFALANPALFRLMISRVRLGNRAGMEGEDDGLSLLFENVRALLPPSTPDDVVTSKAIHAWASVHGLAMLMLDGQLPTDETMIDNVVLSELELSSH